MHEQKAKKKQQTTTNSTNKTAFSLLMCVIHLESIKTKILGI